MTDSRPDSSPAGKPRGLWSLMGTTDPAVPSVDPEPSSGDPEATVTAPPPAGQKQPDEPAVPRQRGLWGMMGQVPAIPSTTSERPAIIADEPPKSTGAQLDVQGDERPSAKSPGDAKSVEPRRGLFALMQSANAPLVEDHVDERSTSDDEGDESGVAATTGVIDDVGDDVAKDVADSADQRFRSSQGYSVAIDIEDLEPRKYRLAAASARRQARRSLLLGLVSIAASALSLLPNVLAGVPATAAGFVAIILGYLSITGAGRRELSAASRAMTFIGMVLGTAGIFLGPLLFASIGRTFREATGHQGTIQHLTQIGDALDRHYQEHDGYPIGGTFARNEAGVIQGQHGWMTFLLPYVGEASLYQEVDQSKPFDDPVNRKSMGRNVTVYFAAGGDRSRIGQGFAVAHFAGLGGEIDDANRLSHLGIFERDVSIKREEVTDGLSNTLIVGELAGAYPPWGDPENWRKIGRGLNRDINGFGSYNGIGATFLLGDGAVKFFNNKTDPKLLERMSTRDGGE